jgi:hypothetical protein
MIGHSAGATRHDASVSTSGWSATRKLPPVAEIAVVSVMLMLSGGVYLAAHLPHPPPLTVPILLVAAGALFTIVDLVILSRIRPFAWSTFFLVLRWAILAYGVIAGLLVYVFVHDHTPASTLAVLTATLVVFAVDVPMILAFTVARFQSPEHSVASPA